MAGKQRCGCKESRSGRGDHSIMQRMRNCGCNLHLQKAVRCQFRVKDEVQTLRTEDFKSDSVFRSLSATYFPWLLRESGETARNLHAHHSIVPFVNSAHIFTYTETTQTLLT